jgi:tetratricopeptide (TPR) repeat protein
VLPRCLFRAFVTLVVLACPAAPAPPASPASRAAAAPRASGESAARRLDWAEAERQFRVCRQQQPASSACAVGHAEALAHLSQPYDGILELEAFVAKQPAEVDALKALAQLLDTVALDRRRAEEFWLRAAKLAPGDASVWHELGAMYAEQQRAAEALDAYTKAVALHPADALLVAGLGYSRGLNGDGDAAERDFKRALALNDRLPHPRSAVLLLYGGFLRDSGRAAESVAAMSRAIAMGAPGWRALYERARSYERLDDYPRAAADAEQALKLAGNRRDIRLLLLRIYRGQGDAARSAEQTAAITQLTAAENAQLAKERELREALRQAEAAVDHGDCLAAVTPYETVTRLLPTFYEAWFPLGVCYSQQGRAADAEAALNRYLGYQPLSADGHAALGLLLSTQRRWADARSQLQQALDLDPALTEAAVALLRADLELHADSSALQRAEALLGQPGVERTAELFALAARAAWQLNQHGQALDYVRHGLALAADDASLQQQHAALLLECVELPACRAELGAALRAHPDSVVYLKAAARTLTVVDPRGTEAERLIGVLLQRLPRDPEAWLLAARWRAMRLEHDSARDAAGQAIALAPPDGAAMVAAVTLRAQSELALGLRPAAFASFDQAWIVNRRCGFCDASSAVVWADQLEREQRDAEAVRLLEEVLTAQPRSAEAQLARARQCVRAGSGRTAVEHGLLALAQARDLATRRGAHALLAQAYASLGETKEAEGHAAWIAALH